jgi:hypothetical protein
MNGLARLATAWLTIHNFILTIGRFKKAGVER